MRRLTAALIAATLVAAGSYVASRATRNGNESPPTDLVVSATAAPHLDELTRLIKVFEQRITDNTDALDYVTLGGFYLDRAYLTGDLEDYRRANGVLRGALQIAPDYQDARRLLVSAALTVHRFEEALALSASILTSDPYDPVSLLVATDANIELGRTGLAAVTLDMVSLLAPDDPALIVRRAELAHLAGAQLAAVDFIVEARRTAADFGVEGQMLAFYWLFEADLRMDLGHYDQAESLVRAALSMAPEWAEAHAALAGVLAARGLSDETLLAYSTALDLRPGDPGWLAERAAVLASMGLTGPADSDLDQAIGILSADDPVIYGRTLARLYADHNIELEESLRLAQEDLVLRQDLAGRDTYAWALYRNGRYAEAADAIAPVVAAGLQDAESRFHAGLILAAAGDDDGARAHLEWVLDTNPGFHPLLAREAEVALAGLGS